MQDQHRNNNQPQPNGNSITDGLPLPTILSRRRSSQPAPTPSTATTLTRHKRNSAAGLGAVVLLAGTYFAAQAYGQPDSDHAYLAGLTAIVCAVIILVGAMVLDSLLTSSARSDEFLDRFGDHESRVVRRMEKIAQGEQALSDMLTDELNPRRK